MNRNTARKAKEMKPEDHGPNAFRHPHEAINRRAKEHPNSWRVKASSAIKRNA